MFAIRVQLRAVVILASLLVLLMASASMGQGLKIAKLKYNGGGDWYANKTSLPNLIEFCNRNLKTRIQPREEVVEVGSQEIFAYPFVHMTGHGNVVFSPAEACSAVRPKRTIKRRKNSASNSGSAARGCQAVRSSDESV